MRWRSYFGHLPFPPDKHGALWLLWALLIPCLLWGQGGMEGEPLVAVIPRDFPPHYIVDGEGKPAGFAIDVIERIASSADLRLTYLVKDSWTEVNEALRSGQADLIPNNGITEQRQKEFAFTLPIETIAVSIFVRRETYDIDGVAELESRRVGAVATNVAVDLLGARGDVDLVVFHDLDLGIFALLGGRIDALVYPQGTVEMEARVAGVADRIKVVGDPLFEIKRGIAVRKGDVELLERLNEAVERFVASEECQQIYRKWYGDSVSYWTVSRVLWVMGILLLLTVACMGAWRHHCVVRFNVRLTENIAQLEQTGEALRKSEGKYHSFIETAHEGVWAIDADSNTTFVNPRMAKMLGCTEEEMVGRHLFSFMDERGVEIAERHLERRKEGIEKQHEFEFLREDGTRIYAVLSTSSLLDEDGHYSGAFAFVSDITGRRQAEEKLRESESLLRNIADNYPNAYLSIIERDYTIGFTSGQEFAKQNLDAEQFVGFTLEQVFGDKVSIIRPHYERTFNGEESSFELFLNDQYQLYRTVPLYSEDGSIPRILAVAENITERKRMEEQIRRANNLESLGVLAGGIAHDFNNVLTGVMGNLALLLRFLDKDSSEYEIASAAQQAATKTKGLTQQLMTFAKGGAPIKEAGSIEVLIRETTDLSLHGANTKAALYFGEDLHSVEIDAGQIGQVIQNLVMNADQAMPNGGILKISAENTEIAVGDALPLASGRYVKVTVKDQGVGIPESVLSQVFDPYFTTKESGHGLGLSITHSIIERHGGHITVSSQQDVGTTFEFYLPASDISVAAATDEPETRIAVGTGRVLLMDDEKTIHQVVGRTLEVLGYEVSSAYDGEEALQIYKRALESDEPFDVVIMDLTIPGGMGGEEAVGKLLEIDSKARAIVSSGYANDPVMANFADCGFVGRVAKPVDIEELADTVKRVLEG
jgi:two-component system, cell cycle sensor histidine kinase and response regulator CckA